MPYVQQQAGETCKQCNASPIVLNPKTGKTFCEKKCWLANSATQAQNQAVTPLPGPGVPINQGTDWDKVNAKKEQSINWAGAKRGAVEITTALLNTKFIENGLAKETITAYANWLYELKPEVKAEKPASDWEPPVVDVH